EDKDCILKKPLGIDDIDFEIKDILRVKFKNNSTVTTVFAEPVSCFVSSNKIIISSGSLWGVILNHLATICNFSH
ncbi:hypothetical protein CEXT_631201, partial [Caerostris extrusa]